MIWKCRVDNALTADLTSAKWFKVGELGLISKDYWGTDSLNANCGKFEVTVPKCIAAGDYLVRAEGILVYPLPFRVKI